MEIFRWNFPNGKFWNFRRKLKILTRKNPVKQKTKLKPLDLVWGKCANTPWYPAIIRHPTETPHQHGEELATLPAPSAEILSQKSENCHLVMFFDSRTTWMWISENKLLTPFFRSVENFLQNLGQNCFDGEFYTILRPRIKGRAKTGRASIF